MFLHRLYPNLRNRDARRDLADPYAMHQTLCRAFVPPERPMPPGMILWRLETPSRQMERPTLLVQSGALSPDWSELCTAGWLARQPDPPLNLIERLELDRVRPGTMFHFRLRANPSKCVNRKRLGLFRRLDQEKWLERVGKERGGFSVPEFPSFFGGPKNDGLNIQISEETMLKGRKRGENTVRISIFSVLFEGVLTVDTPELFLQVLSGGIGHGKAMGLGLLSIAPVRLENTEGEL